MDSIDGVPDLEERERQGGLAALKARIAASHQPRDPSVERTCIDCGDPIEPERWKALRGCTSRCASCAHDHEQRMRRAR